MLQHLGKPNICVNRMSHYMVTMLKSNLFAKMGIEHLTMDHLDLNVLVLRERGKETRQIVITAALVLQILKMDVYWKRRNFMPLVYPFIMNVTLALLYKAIKSETAYLKANGVALSQFAVVMLCVITIS